MYAHIVVTTTEATVTDALIICTHTTLSMKSMYQCYWLAKCIISTTVACSNPTSKLHRAIYYTFEAIH